MDWILINKSSEDLFCNESHSIYRRMDLSEGNEWGPQVISYQW